MEKNKKSLKEKIADAMGLWLFISGIVSYQNAIIWSFQETNPENWFSRFALGIICFGFAGIIFKIKQ